MEQVLKIKLTEEEQKILKQACNIIQNIADTYENVEDCDIIMKNKQSIEDIRYEISRINCYYIDDEE